MNYRTVRVPIHLISPYKKYAVSLRTINNDTHWKQSRPLRHMAVASIEGVTTTNTTSNSTGTRFANNVASPLSISRIFSIDYDTHTTLRTNVKVKSSVAYLNKFSVQTRIWFWS